MIKVRELLEKTFNITKDVEYIYKKAFDSIIKDIQKGVEIGKTKYEDGSGGVQIDKKYKFIISSEDLPSKLSQEASKVNPVVIMVNFEEGNYYNPSSRLINLAINFDALGWLYQNDRNIDSAMFPLPNNQKKSFEGEFSTHKVKGTINHELNHWISDSLRGNFIGKTLKRAQETNNKNIWHGVSVNFSKMEIDSQVLNVKQYKRSLPKDVYDSLTLNDLFINVPSFGAILRSRSILWKDYEPWFKDIIKRLDREKLLGKNMKKFDKAELKKFYQK